MPADLLCGKSLEIMMKRILRHANLFTTQRYLGRIRLDFHFLRAAKPRTGIISAS